MHTTRRSFLRTLAGTASVGLADVTTLRGLRAFADDKPATSEPPISETVRFGPDLEPVIRLIEDTPQDECVRVLVEKLRTGLPSRRLLAGVFFAGIRRLNSFHDVYKIHSVHQVSTQLRPEERLLPLFWTVDGFKTRQKEWPNPALTELTGPLPAASEAPLDLAGALETADIEAVEKSLVVLARTRGIEQAKEQLWLYGCRNGGAGGHGAIAVASCFRALDVIGWEHAEPVLRIALRDATALGGKGKADSYFAPNSARADRHVEKLPQGWSGGLANQAATLELFGLLRDGKPEPACELAVRQLLDGVGSQAIWDAVHLATAELMVREETGWGVASRPLHSNTSAGALRHASRASGSLRTRLLTLLQAVAWAADKTASELRDKSLRDIQITQLPRAELPADSAEAVADIFSQIPLRHYHWDAKAQKAVLEYGKRSNADEASCKVLTLARERPEAAKLYVQAAQSWMCQKATADPHEYKFLAAVLEEAELVSPMWRPHILAASVHFLHGKQSPDFPAVQQAREALKKNG